MMTAGTISANPGSKKLQIFILAGQSNMVGHANSHTMATLYDSDIAGDRQLAQMVFKKDSNLSKKVLAKNWFIFH